MQDLKSRFALSAKILKLGSRYTSTTSHEIITIQSKDSKIRTKLRYCQYKRLAKLLFKNSFSTKVGHNLYLQLQNLRREGHKN